MFDFEEELKKYEKSQEVSEIDDTLIKSEQVDIQDFIVKIVSEN